MRTHDCPACGAAGAGGVDYRPDPGRTATLPRLDDRPVPRRPYICLNRPIVGTDADAAMPCPMAAHAAAATPTSRTGHQAPGLDPWSAWPTTQENVSGLFPAVDDRASEERAAVDAGLFPLDTRTSAYPDVPVTRSSSRPHLRRRPPDQRLIAVIAACAVVLVGIGVAVLPAGRSADLAVPAPTDVPDAPTAPVAIGQPDSPSPGTPTGEPPTATTGPATPSPRPTAVHRVIPVPGSRPAPTSAVPTNPQPAPTNAVPPLPPTVAQPSPATKRSSPTPSTGDPSTLRFGDSGSGVKALQQLLAQAWCYTGKPNGRYDQRTYDAVAQFQSWYAVQGDPPGVYGPATRLALETSFL